MKLPWDKNYLKISFHVIFTILIIYAVSLIIKNIGETVYISYGLIHNFFSIIAPITVALIFSYIINPVVEFFQKWCEMFLPRARRVSYNEGMFKKRTLGTSVTYLIIVLIFVLIIKLAVERIGTTDITEFANSINNSIQGFSDMLVLLQVKLAEIGVLKNLDGFIPEWELWINSFTNIAKNSILNIADTVSVAGGWIINLVVGLTAAFYFLVEKERILHYSKDVLEVFLPAKAKKIENVLTDVNTIFSGYIGGQLTDTFILAVLISVSFSIIGIKYAVIIGIISGFANLIPYVGAIMAFLLSVSVGLISGTPSKALYAAIVVIIIQQIDGMIIVPKVVGKSVELHPVLVLLSLAIFGSLFGVAGMILAVPITAIIKLFLVRFYYRKKEKQS